MTVARVAFVMYQGTVEGFRRFGLPELRRAGMRGWTLSRDASKLQVKLDKAEQADFLWAENHRSKNESPGTHRPTW